MPFPWLDLADYRRRIKHCVNSWAGIEPVLLFGEDQLDQFLCRERFGFAVFLILGI